MHDVESSQKIEILLKQLAERYHAMHQMRERSQVFTIWLLGIFFASAVWVLGGDDPIKYSSALFYFLGLTVFYWFGSDYIDGIGKGFRETRNIAIRIEEAFGLYLEGEYIDGNSILPQDYYRIDENNTSHFYTTRRLLNGTYYILMVWILWNVFVQRFF